MSHKNFKDYFGYRERNISIGRRKERRLVGKFVSFCKTRRRKTILFSTFFLFTRYFSFWIFFQAVGRRKAKVDFVTNSSSEIIFQTFVMKRRKKKKKEK